jgi:hypothetical protein
MQVTQTKVLITLFFDIYYWHGWFSGRVEEYDGKDC